MPSPEKSASKKVPAKLFILQGTAKPLSSVPVWAEPSQLLIGMWAGTIPFRSNLFEITAKRSSTDSRSEVLAQEFPNGVSQSACDFRFIK
jgi:hypothetical protein